MLGATMLIATSLRTVDVVLVFEDGVHKVMPVEWTRDMTVLDALKRARKKPHGSKFRTKTFGDSALVIEIDGQDNDADGNWLYWVNGDFATVSCNKYPLKPGDVVRWEFLPFDPAR